MSVTFESAEDSAPGTSIFATVNDGVPHFWIPDLDANCHTLSDLADAFTRLAVAHGDAIFDYCDCDASGAYFAFRIPWQGR